MRWECKNACQLSWVFNKKKNGCSSLKVSEGDGCGSTDIESVILGAPSALSRRLRSKCESVVSLIPYPLWSIWTFCCWRRILSALILLLTPTVSRHIGCPAVQWCRGMRQSQFNSSQRGMVLVKLHSSIVAVRSAHKNAKNQPSLAVRMRIRAWWNL